MWCFILVLVKSIDIKIGFYNIHFSFYFKGLKSNILHITRIKIQYESILQ